MRAHSGIIETVWPNERRTSRWVPGGDNRGAIGSPFPTLPIRPNSSASIWVLRCQSDVANGTTTASRGTEGAAFHHTPDAQRSSATFSRPLAGRVLKERRSKRRDPMSLSTPSGWRDVGMDCLWCSPVKYDMEIPLIASSRPQFRLSTEIPPLTMAPTPAYRAGYEPQPDSYDTSKGGAPVHP